MTKQPLGPFQNDRVRLRLLIEADLSLTLTWRNRDDVRCWFRSSAIITPEDHWAWFAAYQQRENDYVFIIEELQDHCRPVGQVSLYHIDFEARRAEGGRIMIGVPEARGRGLARQATQLLLDVAFGPFDLREVYLEVFEHNAPALAVYRACGFEEYGRRGNLLLMTRLRSESAS